MILQSLACYYQRLATQTDSKTDQPKVPSYGFSEEKIGWILVLSVDGDLLEVISNFSSDKKPLPKLMSVPRPEKRTSGVKPNFLWDKTAYVLGVEVIKIKPPSKSSLIACLKKHFRFSSSIIWTYCKIQRMKACWLYVVFWKNGNLKIFKIRRVKQKCWMPMWFSP